MYIEAIIFVQSTEMEEKLTACIYKDKVWSYVIRELSLLNHKEKYFHSVIYDIIIMQVI